MARLMQLLGPHFLGRRLCSELTVAKASQVATYVVAMGIFVLATLKLASLRLTEAELFFGILLIGALLSSMICCGTLVRIEAELKERNRSDAD